MTRTEALQVLSEFLVACRRSTSFDLERETVALEALLLPDPVAPSAMARIAQALEQVAEQGKRHLELLEEMRDASEQANKIAAGEL